MKRPLNYLGILTTLIIIFALPLTTWGGDPQSTMPTTFYSPTSVSAPSKTPNSLQAPPSMSSGSTAATSPQTSGGSSPISATKPGERGPDKNQASPTLGAQGGAEEDDDDDESGKESGKLTFVDKVNSIRSEGSTFEVSFLEHYGPYSVPASLPGSKVPPDESLAQAYKEGSPIKVTVDTKTDTLIFVEPKTQRTPASTSKADSGISSQQPLPPSLESYRDILQKAMEPKK